MNGIVPSHEVSLITPTIEHGQLLILSPEFRQLRTSSTFYVEETSLGIFFILVLLIIDQVLLLYQWSTEFKKIVDTAEQEVFGERNTQYLIL